MSTITPMLLNYPNAAAALSMSEKALRELVFKGRGPAHAKFGTRTFFRPQDIQAWVDRHLVPANDPLPAPARLPKGVQPFDPITRRKRGRPTKAEKMARDAHFARA